MTSLVSYMQQADRKRDAERQAPDFKGRSRDQHRQKRPRMYAAVDEPAMDRPAGGFSHSRDLPMAARADAAAASRGFSNSRARSACALHLRHAHSSCNDACRAVMAMPGLPPHGRRCPSSALHSNDSTIIHAPASGASVRLMPPVPISRWSWQPAMQE